MAVRVLVVEDEPLVAMFVESALADLGFEDIHVAHDLATGEALLHAISPGLAVLDVNIGSALVFPLAEALKLKNVPFVFSTARSAREFPPEWSTHPIVPKPLRIQELVDALCALGFNSVQAPTRNSDDAT